MNWRPFLLALSFCVLAVSGTVVANDLVTIVSVSSKREYSLSTAHENGLIYIDRAYAIRNLPNGLHGQPLIQTSNADDRLDVEDHLKLRLNKEATIYVCWDERGFRPAAWLKGWRRVKGRIGADDTGFILYRKVFAAGEIALGGNMRARTGAKSNYFVIVAAGNESRGLEDAHTVDEIVLSKVVDRSQEIKNGAGDVAGPRLTPPTRAPRVPPGFVAKLFAYEPMIHNPCAMAFDAKGRLFVGYGPQYRKPRPNTPGDKVAILIDANEDGVAERKHVFAEGFNCIQGLAWHGNDLWVANAPDLTLVRDLDGDDRADEYVRIYTDLGNLEHGLHGLNWAPDGKLYMSKGNSKGHNRPHEDGRVAPRAFRELFGLAHPDGAPDQPPPVRFTADNYYSDGRGYHNPSDDWGRQGGVLRCGPLGADLEIVARGFRNPWGIAFDDEFCWLGTDNDQDQGDKIFTPFYGAHFGWNHPWSYRWNDPDHLPTIPASGPLFEGSGTGIAYYSSSQFPEEYRGVFFFNDWLRNATYVFRTSWNGALRESQTKDLELFATQADGGLFKPTDVKVGPDGAVYIASWGVEYGAEWKPGEENTTQINEGRIYKIWYGGNGLPKQSEWNHSRQMRPIHAWTVDELVADLDDNSLPVRRGNAQDELVRRGSAVRAKVQVLLQSSSLSTMQQTWLAWALGRSALGDRRIDDWFAGVVEQETDVNRRLQALRILGYRAKESTAAQPLPPAVQAALGDGNARIRFEAVQAIWQAKDRTQLETLLELAANESDQLTFYVAWHALRDIATVAERRAMLDDQRSGVRFAALLGLMDSFEIAKQEVLKRLDTETDTRIQFWCLKWVAAGKPPRIVSNQKERVGSHDNLSAEDLIGRIESTSNRHIRMALLRLLTEFRLDGEKWMRMKRVYDTQHASRPDVSEMALMMSVLSADPRGIPLLWQQLKNSNATIRRAALDGLTATPDARPFLLNRLADPIDGPVLKLAVEALASASRDNGAPLALAGDAAMNLVTLYLRNENTQLRTDIMSIVAYSNVDSMSATSRKHIGKLVQVASQERDPRVRRAVETVAEKLHIELALPDLVPATVEDAMRLLPNADAARGERIFFDSERAKCLTCHRVADKGTEFAPSLSDIGSRLKPEEILESILHPSRKITEGFAVTQIITTNGQALSGVVTSETDTRLELFQVDGKKREVAKEDVELRQLSKSSIMPDGFGLVLAKEELADLTAWLQNQRTKKTLGPLTSSTNNGTEVKASIEFSREPGAVVVTANGHPLATYFYADPQITRPYLAHVHAPGGIQVTRNHPPQLGDSDDHANLHPGIFLAFGDVSGHDYWRLKAKVVHAGFEQSPTAKDSSGQFVVTNHYRSTDDQRTVCIERCRLRFRVEESHYRIDWESTFSSPEADFYFGDQEEMGLGVRVASAIREQGGSGRILNSEGVVGAKKSWGQLASWCDYSGVIGGENVGVTIVPASYNPRQSWWHNRNYGVFVANLFGRRAMKQGPPSRIVIRMGEEFRLGHSVLLHNSGDSSPSFQTLEQRCEQVIHSLKGF